MDNQLLHQYILDHSEPEDPFLYQLYRATNIHTVHGRMASGHLEDKINFMIGDANVLAPQQGIVFDMAFIDGDKRTYIETYEMTLSVLREGGFILADNTLWDGHVVDTQYDKDAQTQGIKRFNDYLLADKRVEQIILPLRDGLTIIRKK